MAELLGASPIPIFVGAIAATPLGIRDDVAPSHESLDLFSEMRRDLRYQFNPSISLIGANLPSLSYIPSPLP